jgi:hypothetical protein
MPTPAIDPGVLLEGDPLAGHLFVQGEAQTGEKTGRFDDVVGRGFGLVSTAGDPTTALGPELAAYFSSIGGFAAHVAPTDPIRDLKGSYARWFAEHGIAAALVRPDFHVFGTVRRSPNPASSSRRCGTRSIVEAPADGDSSLPLQSPEQLT